MLHYAAPNGKTNRNKGTMASQAGSYGGDFQLDENLVLIKSA